MSERAMAKREAVGVPHAEIVAGVLRLAESAGRHVTEATYAVYADVCGRAMTSSEWRAVVLEALESVDGWPSTARLLRLLRELRESRGDAASTPEELEAEQQRWERERQ